MATIEELRGRLGLQDPAVRALQARWANADMAEDAKIPRAEIQRRTGRTTETILHALVHLANTGEPVLLVARNRLVAEHMERAAREYARRLGLDVSMIRSACSPNTVQGRREPLFTDLG